MKFISFSCLALMLFVISSSVAQLPPLIDRELFFDDPEISGAQISPDGKHVSFIKPFMGVRNIWVKSTAEPFDAARPLTADTTRPITGYFWSRDSRYILYVQDKGGDENYRIYAVDPTETGYPVPASRTLTPMEKIRATIIDVPKKTPESIIIGLNDRRADLHDVYRLNIATGEKTLLWQNDQNVAGWELDLDGTLRLATRITSDGGTEILRIENDSLLSIYSVNAEESCSPLRFTPDGKKFYLITNKGTIDKTQLELYDLETDKTSLVDKDPENEVDFAFALFSDNTNELLATFYYGDRVRVYPKTKRFTEDWKRLKKALPDGEISIVSMTQDENLWLVNVSRDVDPGSTYLYDRERGTAELLYRSRPNLPTEHLAAMKPVRFKARDGMTIPGYLTLPKGVPAKKLPTVMYIHGGPWARDLWGYNAVAQFLANRGYAVYQVNFRGSSGYGKKFLNAGNKQWGTGAMQHDITDAVKYVIKEGIADPKRVAIYGVSYGGYATLAGVAFTPELYAAGISFVGPSNIITLLNTIPPYWAPLKKIFSVRVGDLENPDDVKRLEAQSPLNSASNIKAPLMIVQGANDPRVKKSESEQIVVALRDLGRPVEYLLAPDEGHGFAGRENRLAFFTAQERFFAKYLGGRVQESISTEIKKKLDELTVDVSTVTLPEKPTPTTAVSAMNDFRGAKVKPDSMKYTSKMKMMGQEMTMQSKRYIVPAQWNGKSVWRIIEQSSGMMGEGADTLDVDAETLLPLRRSATQGPAKISMTFSADKVEGKILAGPQEMPINVRLNSPVLSEGAGVSVALSTLPLAEGYSAMIDVFNPMEGKVNSKSVKVVGVAKVSIGIGTFEAYKVEVKPTDDTSGGSTLWIDRETLRTVKTETQLPAQMGGGMAVEELTN